MCNVLLFNLQSEYEREKIDRQMQRIELDKLRHDDGNSIILHSRWCMECVRVDLNHQSMTKQGKN